MVSDAMARRGQRGPGSLVIDLLIDNGVCLDAHGPGAKLKGLLGLLRMLPDVGCSQYQAGLGVAAQGLLQSTFEQRSDRARRGKRKRSEACGWGGTCKSLVSLESRKGTCRQFGSALAFMHIPNVVSERLIDLASLCL